MMINLSVPHSIMFQVRSDWAGHHHDAGQERSLRLPEVGSSQDHRHGPASAGTQPGPVRHTLQGMQDTRVIGLLLTLPTSHLSLDIQMIKVAISNILPIRINMTIASNYLTTRNLIISVSLTFGGSASKAVSWRKKNYRLCATNY